MEMHGSPHRSGRGRLLRCFTIGVLLLGALYLIAVYVWTAPVGFVWHLSHGNFTSFDGQRIPVPGDMWVILTDNGGLTIMEASAQIQTDVRALGHYDDSTRARASTRLVKGVR